MHGTASGIGTACAMIVLDVAIGCVATNKNTQVKIRGVEVTQPYECETHSTPQTTLSREQMKTTIKTILSQLLREPRKQRKYIVTITEKPAPVLRPIHTQTSLGRMN